MLKPLVSRTLAVMVNNAASDDPAINVAGIRTPVKNDIAATLMAGSITDDAMPNAVVVVVGSPRNIEADVAAIVGRCDTAVEIDIDARWRPA